MEPSAASLERLVPEQLSAEDTTGAEALRIGLERYRFASRHARPGRLLDLACGVGYGTRLLIDETPGLSEALGVDLAPDAIHYAQSRYAGPRLAYRVGDALAFADPDGFDTVVSIETIEHVPDPARLAARLVALLRPGGRLIASVPVTPSVDANPHHLHDFDERSFRALFAHCDLREIATLQQDQPFPLLGVLRRSERRMQTMRRNLLGWYLRHPDSFARRIASTLRHGFKNRYLTIVWQKPA